MSDAFLLIGSASLAKVAWASILASVVVATAFALVILGLVRSSEMRTAGRNAIATAYATLAVCGLAVCGASVVYGLILVAHKS